MKYRVIGVKETSFEKDGRKFYGYRVYATRPIDRGGEGEGCDSFYLSDKVCAESNFLPRVGSVITDISYNKWARIQRVYFEDAE